MWALACSLLSCLVLSLLERELVDDLLYVCAEINTVIQSCSRPLIFEGLEHFHRLLASMVRMHLLQLLDRLGYDFVNLEQQEGILAQELPGIVFIFIVVHQMMVMGVYTTHG